MPFQPVPGAVTVQLGQQLWIVGNAASNHVEVGTHPADGSPEAGETGIRLYAADGVTVLIDLGADGTMKVDGFAATEDWISYTASFALKAGGTAVAPANYIVDARYTRLGKWVAFQTGLTMQAGFSYGAAAGVLTASVPVLPVNRSQQGWAWINRGGADVLAALRIGNTLDAQVRITGHQASTTDYPAWAAGDRLEIGGVYQAA